MEQYDIFFLDKPVGVAYVEENGLYNRIRCECQMQQECLYRIWLQCDNEEMDLGTCIKDGSRYFVDTKIPRSKMNGEVRFLLCVPAMAEDTFFEIKQGVPFLHLEKLPDSRLAIREGKIGITVSA